MKKLLLITAIALLSVSMLAGCNGENQANAGVPNTKDIQTPTVSNAENSLLDFRFENYEEMSIAEYREQALSLFGTNEVLYHALIEQYSSESGSVDDDTYFIINVFIPIMGDGWENWHCSDNVLKESTICEYTITYEILDAENITMGVRNRAIKEATDIFFDIVSEQGSTKSEQTIREQLKSEITTLTAEYTNDSFLLEMDFSLRVDEGIAEQGGNTAEQTDYDVLLSLQTLGYTELTLSDFLGQYVTLAHRADFEKSYNNVRRDLANNNHAIDLTESELAFLETTLEATASEFVTTYLSNEVTPSLRHREERREFEILDGHELPAFEMMIDCEIRYFISDENRVTVSERDTVLTDVKTAITSFVQTRTADEIVGGKNDFTALTAKLENEYADSSVQIEIEVISYQVHDQRNMQTLD